jgi:acyl-CoA thioester hydrolase
MTVNSAEIFEISISVKESDIDRLGHVNNITYLKWVQDAAVAHWRSAATEAQQEGILWVVTRHEIDYKQPAYSGDEVIVRTWVGKASDLIFERHTEIIRRKDSKIIAKAKTYWCPVNRKTMKPIRVDNDVRKRFSSGENK